MLSCLAIAWPVVTNKKSRSENLRASKIGVAADVLAIAAPGGTVLLFAQLVSQGTHRYMKFSGGKTRRLFLVGGSIIAFVSSAAARPVPQNLVNGLDKIVEYRLSQNAPNNPRTKAAKGNALNTAQATALAREATAYASMAITDATTGKYLVEIMPDGTVPVASLQPALAARFPALRVTATDAKYAGHGVIEGYISVDDAAGIAAFGGVGSVILQLRPIHNVGAVTEFGVNQHRVNKINQLYNPAAALNYQGQGMSIGVMSDSYDSQPTAMAEGSFTTSQQDVATGDLPGIAAATPTAPNTQPVVVLDDFTPTTGAPMTGATNEGRAMCQIVADMAPMARIAFATADRGEVSFANNIRALAGLNGYTFPAATQQGFKADVVCDDVSYLDEPFFQDGVVAQGVIDVVNAGVSYCSSAANNWGTDGYDSDFRPVANGTGLTAAAGNTALAGTNINLTGVDASLYKGGFHNFNPNGLDVAQTLNTAADPQGAVFQWNDPFDSSVPTLGAVVYGPMTGDSTGGSAVNFTVSLTAGQGYAIIEMATPANATENFDAIVDVIDPSGATVISQDTGTDETFYYTPMSTGTYTIRVHPYATPVAGGVTVPTMGHFSLQVDQTSGTTPRITQDFNLLFFDTSGNFISAVATNNFASNRPYELFVPTFNADGYSQVQLVIARSNTTAPANAANHFKYIMFGDGIGGIGPAEYNNYLTPVTFGHSAAAGANSVAAYSCFRPNLPENFTSPGPVTIYFDANNNRLATPQVRRKPDVAAADGSNNTFFPLGPAQDVPFDADSNYANFYGTSAASPHAAAIAALVIQSHGGPGSLKPAQVKTLMQLSAFPHDLDPYASAGTATTTEGGTVTVGIISDSSANTNTGMNDPNSWSVSYTGPGSLRTISFNPQGTAATGGNPTGGNFSGDAAGPTVADFLNPTPGVNSTYYKYTPGMVFQSGSFLNTSTTSTGLTPADATATFTNAAPFPSTLATSSFFWTLNLAFDGNFTTSKLFHFNVARNQQQDAQVPQGMTTPSVLYGQTGQYSADILGDGVLIPEYADTKTVLPGMTFSGTVVDGATTYPFTGRIGNRIGQGYSVLDGYGFMNVEAAVQATLPTPGVVSRKTHGTAGTFDLPLPLTGAVATEPRIPDANNGYQLVYTFAETVNSVGTATVTQGTGAVASSAVGPNPNQVTVNLTGVTNAQRMIVTLSGVLGNSGTTLAAIPANVNILVGDVNASGRTDSGDVALVRSKGVVAVDQSNFLYDVNLSGRVDSGDVTTTRSYTVTALP